MKQFYLHIDDSNVQTLPADALAILSTTVKEQILESSPQSPLTRPEEKAEKGALLVEEQLLELDKRLKRGLTLLLRKLPSR